MKTLTSVRVLVVDDDEDSREMIRAALELQGASATCVADAHQALAEFKMRRPDVVAPMRRRCGPDAGEWPSRLGRRDGPIASPVATA